MGKSSQGENQSFEEFVYERIQHTKHCAPKIRRRYLEALAASLSLDLRNPEPPRPLSPRQIDERYKIGEDEQNDYGISIKRKEMKLFLSYIGMSKKKAEIVIALQERAYKEFYGRNVSKLRNKKKKSPTIYTYAEVAQRFGLKEQFDLPQQIADLFEQEKIDFPISFT